MSPEEKDQLSQPEVREGEESAKGFDEEFEVGWKKYEEERDLAISKAEGKEPPAKKEGEAKSFPKNASGKEPYKILKVQGKEIPVYSKEELAAKIAEMYGDDDKMVDLGQLSQDYTRKRQKDSEERKAWEEKYQQKADELNQMGKKFNDIWDRLEAKEGRGKPAETKPQEDKKPQQFIDKPLAEVYKEYNLDPEFAQDHEKKLIEDMHNTRRVVEQMNAAMESATKTLHFFQIKEVVSEIGRIITEEREASPFDDYVDEKGTSLTLQEFSTLLSEKAKNVVAQGQKLNLDTLTRETIREISTKQAKAKASVELSDDMSEEEFAKRYPKLAQKFGRAAGQSAVDKHVGQESKLPPSLDRRTKEVDLKKQPSKEKGPKGMDERLSDAFSDPDILNALQGR